MFRTLRFGKRNTVGMVLGLLVLVSLIGLVVVPSVGAFESRSGDTVVIESDEVIDDDLYVFAARLDLQGTVNGDVIFFGQTAIIDGTITGDLISAGQQIAISGQVEDDVRVAGYAVEVSGQVGDDLVAAGFSLWNGPDASLGGDVVFAGYQALLDGQVTGDASVAGGAVAIEGTIEGDATVDVSGSEMDGGGWMPPGFPYVPGVPSVPSVPTGLTVDDDAQINGDLSYTANQRAEFPEDTVGGQIEFTRYIPKERRERRAEPSTAMIVLRWFVRQLRRLITLLLLGTLMLLLVPGWTRRMETIVRSKPWPSLGWGVVALIAFIGGMIVLTIAVTLLTIILSIVTLGELSRLLVGLGLLVSGGAGFGFTVVWSYVTRIVISLLLGHLVFRLFGSKSREQLWWPGLVGVLILVAITAVPVLGWLVGFVTALLGLGALWIWVRERIEEGRTRPAEALAPEET